MSAVPPYGARPLATSGDETMTAELIAQFKELTASTQDSPFRVVDLAIEIQAERARVLEVLKARDAAVERLSDAYILVRRYSEFIERLQADRIANGQERLQITDTPPAMDPHSHVVALEQTINELRDLNAHLKVYHACEAKSLCDPPPNYEENGSKIDGAVQTDGGEDASSTIVLSDALQIMLNRAARTDESPPDVAIKWRHEFLVMIPLPETVPDLTLSPISLPPQVTLHEFLNGSPSPLRNLLGNYRTLQSTTVSWCPEREEHGFMYVPMFKCNTNPRTITAHRWYAVDVIGRMAKPTECFYNNEGTWYYAGVYKAFLLGTVSINEWECLSSETKTALIKETLAARKNTTPQTNYETGQLYSAGALKLACVGLQCVGFSQDVYDSVSEMSSKLIQSTAAAAAAAAAAAFSSGSFLAQSPLSGSPTASSTPGSLPKNKFTSSPLFNGLSGKQLPQGSSSTSVFNLTSAHSSSSGTPPLYASGLREMEYFPPSTELGFGFNGAYSQASSATHYRQLLPVSKASISGSPGGNATCTTGVGNGQTAPSGSGTGPIGRPDSAPLRPGDGGNGGQGVNVQSTAPTTTSLTPLEAPIAVDANGHSSNAAIVPPLQPHAGLGTSAPIWNSAVGSHLTTYLSSLTRPGVTSRAGLSKAGSDSFGISMGRPRQ